MKDLDTLVNQILTESFEVGDRNATQKAGARGKEPGGIQRQMLAGEFVSSPGYFTQFPSSAQFAGLNNLLAQQSEIGLGEIVKSFVEGYLEDTAVDIYTNPNNVDYLIRSLQEAGYDEYASAIDAITRKPSIEDVAKINEMVKDLSKEPKNEYFTESLIYIAEQIVDEEEAAAAGEDAPSGGEFEGTSDGAGSEEGTGTESGSEAPANAEE